MLMHENNGEWNVIPEKIFHSLEKVKVKKTFILISCIALSVEFNDETGRKEQKVITGEIISEIRHQWGIKSLSKNDKSLQCF